MARPRRNYTHDPMTLEMLERHANEHHNGNLSKALDALIRAGVRAKKEDGIEALAYAGLGTTALTIFIVAVQWLA